MTYTILAIVVLVVVVLFVLLSRKQAAEPGPAEKKAGGPEAKPKSIQPGPGPKAPDGATKEPPSAAGVVVAETPAPARVAAPAPKRDLAELRKGLSKARGE
jgi:hypothetical protein